MRSFLQSKFLGFSKKKQHKECAHILGELYHSPSAKPILESLYKTYLLWMNQEMREIGSLELLSNAYHFHMNQADIHIRENHFLPAIKRWDNLTESADLGVTTYLDHLRSAHNVGSILRTVEAFRLGPVVFSEDTPLPSNKKVLNTSMGSSELVKCLSLSIALLPRPLIALETSPSAKSIFNYEFQVPMTLAVGNEEYGCSEEILDNADVILQIPLRGRKNSLNVANAFAIYAALITNQITSFK